MLHGNGVCLGDGNRDIFRSRRLASPLHVGSREFSWSLYAQVRIVGKQIARLLTSGNYQGPGETVLLQGSGGVSLFALQLAVAHGARVLVTSRSPGKVARLKQLGAAEVINTSVNPAWDEVVLRLTDGRGADHILDVIRGDAVPRSIETAAWRGHIAVIGFMDRSATTISIPNVMVKNLRLQGVSHSSRADMEESLAFVEKHRIPPIIDARYPFGALRDALDHGPFGKLVVEIN